MGSDGVQQPRKGGLGRSGGLSEHLELFVRNVNIRICPLPLGFSNLHISSFPLYSENIPGLQDTPVIYFLNDSLLRTGSEAERRRRDGTTGSVGRCFFWLAVLPANSGSGGATVPVPGTPKSSVHVGNSLTLRCLHPCGSHTTNSRVGVSTLGRKGGVAFLLKSPLAKC